MYQVPVSSTDFSFTAAAVSVEGEKPIYRLLDVPLSSFLKKQINKRVEMKLLFCRMK